MLPNLGGYLVAGSNVNLARVEKFIKEVRSLTGKFDRWRGYTLKARALKAAKPPS